MRLWTIHPKHLDAKGLVALWREALLAQKVLQGMTRGYRHHPQLLRFRAARDPAGALASYLAAVYEEAVRRGYQFDSSKIGARKFRGRITETKGQLLYEWRHLKRKLSVRDPARHRACRSVPVPEPHPLFRLIAGDVQAWEKPQYGRAETRPQDRQKAIFVARIGANGVVEIEHALKL